MLSHASSRVTQASPGNGSADRFDIVERSILDVAERLKGSVSFETTERIILENLAPGFPENLARGIVARAYGLQSENGANDSPAREPQTDEPPQEDSPVSTASDSTPQVKEQPRILARAGEADSDEEEARDSRRAQVRPRGCRTVSNLLIPNTCQVPNVLFDEVMREIPDPSLRVLLAVVRKTYGFQKQSDHISLTQLQELTGLSRQGVVNGIKGLGSLITIQQGKPGKREGNEYALNLDIETGKLVNGVDQSMGLTSQRSGKTTSQRRRHTKPNKNKTHIGADFHFERAWKLYPKRAGGNPKKAALKAWAARVRSGVDPDEMIAGVERYAKFIRGTGKEDTEFVKHAATFFGPNEYWKEPWHIPAEHARTGGGLDGGYG